MAGGVGHRSGGIVSLLGVLRDHGEAVEYDLLRCGLRREWLGSEQLTWRDLSVIVRQAQPDTALYKAMAGDRWPRTTELELLRMIERGVRVLAWQQGRPGQPYPELIEMPWDEPAVPRPDEQDFDAVVASMEAHRRRRQGA